MTDVAPALDAAVPAIPRVHGPRRRFWLLAGSALSERFGWYGLRSLIVLYMVDATKGGLGWTEDAAVATLGFVTAASVLSPLLGGFLADRFLGALGAARLGALAMFIGLLVVDVSSSVGVMLGLGMATLGSGLVRPSLYALLAGLHVGMDHRQDAAFTLFTMPIDVGAFLAPVVCGTVGALFGWSWAFSAAAAGLMLGLGLLLAYPNGPLPGREQRMADPSVVPARSGRRGALVGLLAVVGTFAVVTSLASSVLLAPTPAESTIDLLIQGGAVTALGFLLAPVFAWLWIHLGRRGRDLRIGTKLVLGMCLGCAGLLVNSLGASIEATPALAMALALGSGLLEGAGLACLYPLVLSALTRVASSSSLAFSVALGTLLTFVLPPRLSGLTLELVPGLAGAVWWLAPAAALVLIATMAVLGRRLEPRAAS